MSESTYNNVCTEINGFFCLFDKTDDLTFQPCAWKHACACCQWAAQMCNTSADSYVSCRSLCRSSHRYIIKCWPEWALDIPYISSIISSNKTPFWWLCFSGKKKTPVHFAAPLNSFNKIKPISIARYYQCQAKKRSQRLKLLSIVWT